MTHQHYSSAFYDRAEQSAAAARLITSLIKGWLPIGSVLDVGCARGTWLAAWMAAGSSDVTGLDGAFVSAETMLIPLERFRRTDLAQPFQLGRRFDLVQCLEVAEHLPAARSVGLVEDLTAHGDAVLFSAAPPGQGGAGHINERPYEFWRALFAAKGYEAFDAIRPALTLHDELPYWYRYNILLYVKRGVAPPALLGQLAPGQPIVDIAPWAFRLRKQFLRRMPQSIIDRLANLNARLHRACQ
ncbi:MAG: methyltransferase domain-containing protein [Rhodospirillales bacterium]|nr:methyltransferase domain-containing protein [Rhodospirillales bacterium]